MNKQHHHHHRDRDRDHHHHHHRGGGGGGGGGDGEEKPRTLWVGDLEPYMDDEYVRRLFMQEAREISSIKIIKDRNTGLPAGYGFVEFTSHQTADRVLNSYGGKPIPAVPGRIYRLNWATFSVGERRPDPNPQHAVFVGDLAPEVNDYMLFTAFQSRYPSVTSAKVVLDQNTGISKGYGFVRFGNDEESRRCMEEMQGAYIGSRPIKLNIAAPKRLLQQTLQQQQQTTPKSSQLSAQQIADASADPNNTTIYVGGIDETVDEHELRRQFQVFGTIMYVKIPQGKKCGFVCFSRKEDAERALRDMNGTLIGSNRVKLSWGRTSTPGVVTNTAASSSAAVPSHAATSVGAGNPAYAQTAAMSATPAAAATATAANWNYNAYWQQYYWQQYYQQQQQQSTQTQQQTDFSKFDVAKSNAEYIRSHSGFYTFSELSMDEDS